MQNLNFWLPREETKKIRLWDNLGYKIHLLTTWNLKIAATLRTCVVFHHLYFSPKSMLRIS